MRVKFFLVAFLIIVTGLMIPVMLPGASTKAVEKAPAKMDPVERGKYLVRAEHCDACHSPKVMTPKGPVPDMDRRLSGHPADSKLPPSPAGVLGPDGWGAVTSADFTVWVGPWGTSFTANLTPDKETGLGSWTEDIFVQTIRTGKHLGVGRDLLPPMPWRDISQLNDDDLKAVYAFLKTLTPIHNAVPDPIPPAQH